MPGPAAATAALSLNEWPIYHLCVLLYMVTRKHFIRLAVCLCLWTSNESMIQFSIRLVILYYYFVRPSVWCKYALYDIWLHSNQQASNESIA